MPRKFTPKETGNCYNVRMDGGTAQMLKEIADTLYDGDVQLAIQSMIKETHPTIQKRALAKKQAERDVLLKKLKAIDLDIVHMRRQRDKDIVERIEQREVI